MLLLARLLHIVVGVFWGGAVFFAALLLVPAVRDAGPEGGKVMGALVKRGLLNVLPASGIVTVLSGIWLYWKVSAGFNPDYMGSRPGMVYGLGMITALIALAIGVLVMRPAVIKSATAEPALAQQLRGRAAAGGRWVAVFVGIAVVCMAIARYV